MTIKKVEMYACTICGKKYEEEREQCSCEKALRIGETYGSFKLLSKVGTRKWRVNCLFCGMDCFVDYANLQKQKSCGCKPRHIILLNVSENYARYRCERCQESVVQSLPILEWCCNDL